MEHIHHLGEKKAGNGEVYKTKMIAGVHTELISPNPTVLEIRDVFKTCWQQEWKLYCFTQCVMNL